MQSESSGIALPPPFKISAVVKEIDKAIEFLSASVDLGPWEIFEFAPRKEELMVGEPCKIKVAWANMGAPPMYELHQPLEGRSVWSQILETKGEGLYLLAYSVPSTWEKIVKKLQAHGARMLEGGTYEGKRWCYLETRPGGIWMELTEEAP